MALRSLILWLLCALPAAALECRTLDFLDTPYSVCEADLTRDRIELFHADADGRPIGTFARLKAQLAPKGKTLLFAMNAGMYHADRAPVGLFIEDGQTQKTIVTREGPGNFGLLPNGVFCVTPERAVIRESRRFAKSPPACAFASQSGPMLVLDGALHPRFLKNGTSRYIRNGVGVSRDGTRVVFAISDRPVNFYDFGRLFKEALNTPNALYFDGKISRMYAPALGRNDPGFPMGPIVGVTAAP